MKSKIYLDDVRTPIQGDWVVVRNYDEFVKKVNEIGLENIVLETDGPYLAPVPFRGTRNEPAYILDIALKIADILGLSLLEIEKQTQLNVQSIFRI